ncbi:MAG: hypothetical protein V4857_22175 [Pseudomonadota bacterium]
MIALERLIRELTTEINGQYPRPWMTSMQEPWNAKVFVVGYNPAKEYSASGLEHERHIHALFNRNGETCRGLYTEITKASPTRGNIEMLTTKLADAGVMGVLETNVVCYATGTKKELKGALHAGGKSRGTQIFQTLVSEIRPKAIVLHGKGVRDEFNRSFKNEVTVPPPSDKPGAFPQVELSTGTRVFAIPSLALPGYQNWPAGNSFCNWSDAYLDELARQIAAVC